MSKSSTFQGLAPALYKDIVAKTAAYQIVPRDVATLFTNRGASGAVILTLPATAKLETGWWCEWFTVADEVFTITAPAVDTMVVFNDAAADTVGFGTSGEHIGGGGKAVWDGTGWLVFLNIGMDSQTPVIAT